MRELDNRDMAEIERELRARIEAQRVTIGALEACNEAQGRAIEALYRVIDRLEREIHALIQPLDGI